MKDICATEVGAMLPGMPKEPATLEFVPVTEKDLQRVKGCTIKLLKDQAKLERVVLRFHGGPTLEVAIDHGSYPTCLKILKPKAPVEKYWTVTADLNGVATLTENYANLARATVRGEEIDAKGFSAKIEEKSISLDDELLETLKFEDGY